MTKLLLAALMAVSFSWANDQDPVITPEKPVLLGEWNGVVIQGNRACTAKLYSVDEKAKTVDVEVSMNVLFHGSVVVKTYRFEKARQVQVLTTNGKLRSAYAFRPFSGQAKLNSAVFEGLEGNEFRDLLVTSIEVPHGSHSHTYQCRF